MMQNYALLTQSDYELQARRRLAFSVNILNSINNATSALSVCLCVLICYLILDRFRRVKMPSTDISSEEDSDYNSSIDEENRLFPSPGNATESTALLTTADPDQQHPLADQEPPSDKYWCVYGIFFLMGMSTLLPWNFFISLNNFWDYKFREVSNSSLTVTDRNQTELQKEFASYLSISSTVPNAAFVILNACFGQRFCLKRRIVWSLSAIIVLFAVVSALAVADSDQWQSEFLYATLTIVVFINVNSAIFQGGSFGVAGRFPPKYIGAQMAGQAMGGVFPALVDIAITATKVEEKDVGFYCFLIATLVLLASLVAFLSLYKCPFFLHYNRPAASNGSGGELSRMTHVLQLSWPYLASIVVTFTVTLSVFPSVAVLVESEGASDGSSSTWAADYFNPVCCFLLFNLGDLFGRSLATWIQMPGRTRAGKSIILVASLCRVVFVPLFMYCNAAPTQRSRPVLFGSDADFVTFMVLFSVSNGYLGNICMLHGPKMASHGETQEAIALVLIAGLVVGAGIGSFLSYPLTKAL